MNRSVSTLVAVSLCLCVTACHPHSEGDAHGEHEQHKIVATSPQIKDVTVTQRYVCMINAQEITDVRCLHEGFIEDINIREGQSVKQGEVLFKILPTLFQARLAAERAEARLAEQQWLNSQTLSQTITTTGGLPVGSQMEVVLKKAELDKANAKVKLAEAELDFCTIRARFDGMVDRLYQRRGSLVKKEDILTTLSDNSRMWVTFNVPEARYFDYKRHQGPTSDNSRLELVDSKIELMLADGSIFDQSGGNTVTLAGKFNNETGNMPFRADFPNPNRLLRHGQTGNLLIHYRAQDSMVIPQRATYELLDKRYVYVIGKDNHIHHREIEVKYELDDVFVVKEKETDAHGHVKKGLDAGERIVLEGGRASIDGSRVAEYEYIKPEEALANLKQPAE